MLSLTSWRAPRERQCGDRYRFALRGRRARHRQHGRTNGWPRGAARVVRRRSGRRAWHQRGSLKAIEAAWSESGVAILVDLGGAETNSEMAIEMLPAARRERVVVCNAPIVEGAVMAATEAASGATLDAVRRTAEELTPR